jgi:hypothetical protein
MPNFWIARIEYKNGDDHWLCKTEDDALNCVDAFVCNNWKADMGDDPLPATREERLAEYFADSDENFYGVWEIPLEEQVAKIDVTTGDYGPYLNEKDYSALSVGEEDYC